MTPVAEGAIEDMDSGEWPVGLRESGRDQPHSRVGVSSQGCSSGMGFLRERVLSTNSGNPTDYLVQGLRESDGT